MKEYIIRTDLDIKTCQDCPLVIRHKNGSTTCPIKKGSERKYGTCPLVELPPHGDLGDTSELYVDILADLQTSKIQTLQDVLKILKVHFNNAPVILKANYKED